MGERGRLRTGERLRGGGGDLPGRGVRGLRAGERLRGGRMGVGLRFGERLKLRMGERLRLRNGERTGRDRSGDLLAAVRGLLKLAA